jgi:hypothetical protein
MYLSYILTTLLENNKEVILIFVWNWITVYYYDNNDTIYNDYTTG